MANRKYVQVVLNIPKEWVDDLQINGATTGLGKLVLKALNTGEGVLPKPKKSSVLDSQDVKGGQL